MTAPAAVAVQKHCEYWNARNREAWIAIFAPDVVFEDPVGSPPKVGLESVRNQWDRSLTPGREWRLVAERIAGVGDEVAIVMRNEGNIHGEEVLVVSLEVWKVDAAGLVTSVRAFFEPDPSVQSEYFQLERDTEQDA
jgi:hypothetical protein